jgi:hypothetical protein
MFRKFSIYFTLLLLLLWIGLVQSATVNLSIDETTVSEGNFFTLTVSLDISASEDTTGLGTVLVRFTTVPDNDQSDFSSLPTSTTLDLANPVKSFAVLAEDDNVVEEPETFTFKIGILLSSGNVTVGESTPSVTVRDRNPGKLEFTSSNYFVDENGVNAIITVERVDGSDGEISVDYATSDDTAIAGTHYHAAQGTLTWVDKDSNPQPITVVIFDNESYDGDKTLKLSLSQPSGGATLGLRNPATVTIKDDETPPPPPTVDPDTVTLNVGNSTELNISGGTPPYQVISTDENVATVSITGNVATVTAIGTGTATIRITDQARASVDATVNVIAPPPTVEPNTVTLKVGNSTELNISGGIPPYEVISTDENVATVSITGNVATVTAIGTGSAIIKITDQASASVEATVIVIPPPLAVGPDTVTLKVGNKKELNISGGTPRYEVISTDETVATVSLTGNVVTVTAIGTGTATIRITDQAGASVEVIVNVILCDLIEGKPCLYWKLDREQNSDSIIKVGERLTLNLELIDIQDANTDQAFDLYVAFALPPEYVIPLVFLSDIGFVTEIRPLKKNIKPEDNSFTNLNPILDFEVGECLGDETYTYYAALFDQDNDELASNLAVGEVTFEDKCD